jgi:cyanophycinase-like exopeptidase
MGFDPTEMLKIFNGVLQRHRLRELVLFKDSLQTLNDLRNRWFGGVSPYCRAQPYPIADHSHRLLLVHVLRLGLLFLVVAALHGQKPMHAQGALLLVGGGTEDYGDWSDAPYGWAVEQADSGRVLIVGSGSASTWLPDYFKALGASHARNLAIPNAATANASWLADTVATYDLVFFQGGDQWDYIEAFRSSAFAAAIADHWSNGKALGGTSAGCAILGGWMFSAAFGTVYPDEVLEDPFNVYMAFEPGLWSFWADWIFDTHYTERGRQGRLPGFSAHLEHTASPRGLPRGLGVDDRTALCISPAGEGLVMGSGTVSSLRLSGNGLLEPGMPLHLDSVLVGQARHGDRISMWTGAVSRSGSPLDLRQTRQRSSASVWLSGNGSSNANDALLDDFSQVDGVPRNRVLILGEGSTAPLNAWANALLSRGVGSVDILTPDPAGSSLASAFLAADAVLLTRCSHASIMALRNGPNGQLADSLFRNGLASAWVGANARHAGAVVLEGYDAPLASYTGSMQRRSGWGLLSETVVLPEAYQDADRRENVAAGTGWAMVADSLRHGLVLDLDACAHFYPAADGYYLQSLGQFPSQWWTLDSTLVDTVDQLLLGASAPRQMGAFGQASLQILSDTSLRIAAPLTQPSHIVASEQGPRLDPLPSPLGEWFTWPHTHSGHLLVSDLQGRVLFESRTGAAPLHTSTQSWPAGMVLVYWTPISSQGPDNLKQGRPPAFRQRLLVRRP